MHDRMAEIVNTPETVATSYLLFVDRMLPYRGKQSGKLELDPMDYALRLPPQCK